MRTQLGLYNAIKIFGAVALNVFACVSFAAQAPGGSSIINIATVSYEINGIQELRQSNPSSVPVRDVPNIQLTADQSISRLSGVTVNLSHRLTNIGNVSSSYLLTATNLLPDNYDFSNIAVYLDSNGNGVVDAGEPVITSTSALNPGQSVQLVISADVPNGLNDSDFAQLQLEAVAVGSPAVNAINTDTVTISSGVILDVIKSNTPQCATPVALGDEIDYALRLSNVGTATPNAINYVIDSVNQSGLILQDELPAEVDLIKAQTLVFTPVTAIPVVKLASSASLNQWQSFAVWNGSDAITHFGLFMPVSAISPSVTRNLNFKVIVKNNLAGATVTVDNVAGVDTDLDGTNDFLSASVCNTVLGLGDDHSLINDESGTSAAGLTFSTPHVLTNTGGATDSYQLSLLNQIGDDFNFNNIRVVHDLNSNGVADLGEPVITATPNLVVSESISLIVIGDVPITASAGQIGQMQLTSTSVNSPAITRSVTSTATLINTLNQQNNSLRVVKGIVVGSDSPVSLSEAELGDRIKYQVTVSNISNTSLPNTILIDVLPFGFKYENSSALRDGGAVVPTNVRGAELRFSLGTLLPNTATTVTYVLNTTAGSLDSSGINTAQARSGNILSNVAQAQVKVKRTGLMSDRSILFGKVFIDANCDAIQADAEWPVAGVRLYMENGTHVTTDENGMYSLYGINPGQHVIKLDRLTLPTGIKAIPTETRHGADPYSRFVDLYDGEFHRADFVFSCPGENAAAVIKQLEERHRSISGNWLLDEAVKFNDSSLLAQNNSGQSVAAKVQPAYDGDISSGIVGRKAKPCCGADSPQSINNTPSADYPHSTAPARNMPVTEDIVEQVTNSMAKQGTWLWPKEDVSYGGRLMVVVREGVKPSLYVNGTLMSAEQLGEHIINKREKAQVLAWYGLPLNVGDNDIKVVTKDMFGNERVMAERVLYHPGNAVNVKLALQAQSVPADGGRSTVPIKIYTEDENGRTAKGTYFVTVEAGHGTWVEQDIQSKTPGFQVKIENGEGLVHLKSSDYIGDVKVRVSLNEFENTQKIDFLPVLRPLLAVGLIDIGGHFSNVSSNGVLPTAQKDNYQDELEVHGRAAMFLKGKVKGDMLLTLSYDSDKQEEDLFRDIDPEAYYPIYGDSSVKGFDAQSKSKLYVKLEKNKNSIMWGDYQTDTHLRNATSLGRVSESLTGLNAHYEKQTDLGTTQVSAYAARVDNLSQFEELKGRGTATGYRLSSFPVAANTEQITIVTIDRENAQPGTSQGVVIKETKLERFVDYDLNRLNGFITFFEVVPSVDENGNEVYIRITYQSEKKVDEYTVAGARITQSIAEGFAVGASASTSDQNIDGYKMASVFAEFKPSEKHQVLAEIATRDNNDNTTSANSGDAARLEWKSKWTKKLSTEVNLGSAEEGFKNNVAPVASGRQEAKAKGRYSIAQNTTLNADLLHSASNVSGNDEQRDSAALSVTQRINKWNVTAGVKRTEQQQTGSEAQYNSVTGRVERGFTLAERNGKAYLAGEREVGADSRQHLELGTEYQLHQKVSMYARVEQIDSATNISSLNTNERRINAAVGFKSNWLPSTQLYSEYRLQGAIDGRELQAVNGVRGAYEIKPKVTFSPSFEVIDTLQGDDTADAIALSLSLVDNSHENLRQAVRFETRQAERSDFYSLDYSYAARINLDWSALYRDQFTTEEPKAGEKTMRNTFTVGLARRPLRNNRWHSLYLLQWKEERNIAEDERRAYILSTHQNYQLRRDLTLSGRLAGKMQTQVIDATSYDSTAQLLGGRLIWGINRRWDMDFRLGLLSAEVGDDLRHSIGIGANYLINKNIRFGLGLNFVGFSDEDLDAQKYHAEGVYFGLQYKFDETLFEWLR